MPAKAELTLVPERWYGWQMLPGYGDAPYFSPILVHAVEPLKSGGGTLRLTFWNVGYAEGVQDFRQTLRVLKRQQTYLVAEIVDVPERTAIISEMSVAWLKTCCPRALPREPGVDDAQSLLRQLFGPGM